MFNVGRTLWGIFGILFVLSMTATVSGQQDQQSGSSLSESQYIKIIEKINESDKNVSEQIHGLEIKMREHIDKKITELNKNYTNIDKDMAYIKGMLYILIGVLVLIGAPVSVHFIIQILDRRNKDKEAPERQDMWSPSKFQATGGNPR